MHRRSMPTQGLLLMLALVWLLISILPFAFVVNTSFKTQLEILTSPVWALPEQLNFANFVSVLKSNFFTFLRNSVIVVLVSVVLILIISSLAAFAFARLRFRLNTSLFALIVAGLVIPVHITLVPIYLMTRSMGVYDTLLALIGPYVAFSLPLSIFILTEFMRQIPRELEEAAKIDGCGVFRLYAQIFLPLAAPGLVTVAIYNAIFLWNEFVFAYVLTSTPENRTLPLAIWEYQGEYASNTPAILAVVTLSSLPLIIAYIFGQERIIKGMMAGALKG